MARLILLNGPPGSGKSTIAKMYVVRHRLALNLDVDMLRSLIGGWQDAPQESGLLARQAALAAAAAHLGAGHDVVVPQYLGRADFIEQLAGLAGHVDARFHEVVLMTSRDEAVRRFDERSRSAAEQAHLDAQKMSGLEGAADPVGAMYDRLTRLLADRPAAAVVASLTDRPADTYERVVQALTAREPQGTQR